MKNPRTAKKTVDKSRGIFPVAKKKAVNSPARRNELEGGEPDPHSRLNTLYDQLILLHQDAKTSPKEYGDLIDQFRKLLCISAREFAKQLDFSLSTYNRWRSGEGDRPPIHRIKEFRALIGGETTPETTRHSIFFDENKRLTIRPFSQLLDRQSKCHEAWSFKHLLPFGAGSLGPIQDQIVDLLTDDNHKVIFHCVFLGPKKENIFRSPEPTNMYSRFPAMDSFAALKRAVHRKNPEAAMSRLHGWLVNSASVAFKIGLSNGPVGTSILVYDEEKTNGVRNLQGRPVDIFQELPLAIYRKDDHAQLAGGFETRWLEVDPNLSRKLYFLSLESTLMSIRSGSQEGIIKFLDKEKDIELYKPRIWD